jgi:hypothetical protein
MKARSLRGAVAVACALSCALACPAMAAEPPPKRDVPNYDGRGAAPTDGGDVALWVPRILLSPLYFTSEYVETSNVPKALYDLFTFGPDHSAGFAPIGFIDFGFNPSVGLYAFWNDAFAKGNDLRLHATTWGADWLAGVVTDRVHLDERRTVAFRFAGLKRPDFRFHGVGPDAGEGDSRDQFASLQGGDRRAAAVAQDCKVVARPFPTTAYRYAEEFPGMVGG